MKKRLRDAQKHDVNYLVLDGKLMVARVGTSTDLHGDGTSIYTETHLLRPTRVTTLHPNGHCTVRYEPGAWQKRT